MPRHLRTCHLCEAMCGVVITTDVDARIVRIEGDPDDVLSRGYICPKAWALKDLHEDPDRLRQPMRREGDRWQEIGWDEALEEAATGLAALRQEGGPTAVGFYTGNPTVHDAGALLGNELLKLALNTEAKFSASTLDQMPKQVSNWMLYGNQLLFAVPDLDRTQLLVMLGANPLASNGSLMVAPGIRKRLLGIQERGGRVVVIDPRRTETAELADQHCFIRPGTDAFLLAAVARLLLDQPEPYPDPVGTRVMNREPLMYLLRSFTPEAAAERSGVPAETIRSLAADLAHTDRAVLYGRMGTCTQAYGTLCSWLIDVVNLLAGNLDRIGGAMFPEPAIDVPMLASYIGEQGDRGRWQSRVRGAPECMGELPAACMAEEITTPGAGRMRGLIVLAGNPVLSSPAGHELDAALGNLELMVSVDPYLNETSRRAHLILPPASSLERMNYDAALSIVAVRNVAKWSPPTFPRTAGSRTDWEILSTLAGGIAWRRRQWPVATALGALRRMSLERLLDWALRLGPYGRNGPGLSLRKLRESPHGVDLGPLRTALGDRIQTRDRIIDLTPDLAIGEMKRLQGALDEAPQQGMVLIGRRHLRSNNSWLHNAPTLAKGPDRCLLLISPDDAKRLNVDDGTRVRVTSQVGEVTVEAAVRGEMMPGVVSLPHGWGHDLEGARLSTARLRPGVNSNRLTDPGQLDPASGTSILNGIPVIVVPAVD